MGYTVCTEPQCLYKGALYLSLVHCHVQEDDGIRLCNQNICITYMVRTQIYIFKQNSTLDIQPHVSACILAVVRLYFKINHLNAELNPLCRLLALLAHPIFHISRIRVNKQLYNMCVVYPHAHIV
jgi:hypothetical protein